MRQEREVGVGADDPCLFGITFFEVKLQTKVRPCLGAVFGDDVPRGGDPRPAPHDFGTSSRVHDGDSGGSYRLKQKKTAGLLNAP